MNVLLADHAHRVIKIPATSIRSIIGVEHADLPGDKKGCKSILRYDFGAGPMFAWLRTAAEQVMVQATKFAPAPWVPLTTTEGDDVYLLAPSIIATHGLDPDECAGANTRVDFDAFGDGREIKFATVVETDDEIEAARAVVEASLAEALQPKPAQLNSPRPARRARNHAKR
ncbi:hypothetical protein [uncultured Sphingomonas sp.]|uniref:hypothetical protein n=1 Tax=uncultured Sphingomonas sp. TaxID=158754 RepID=UPI00260322E9|nr:hypothetical protein [uncultured Sphingomonas sp.]